MLVFIPGFGNSAHVFDEFAPRFTDRYRVIGASRVGFGESDQPTVLGYSMPERLSHLRAILDSLGAERVVLIGHSLGGSELTEFAGAYPSRVEALVYLDAAYDHKAISALENEIDSMRGNAPMPTASDRASAAAYRNYLRKQRGVTWPVGEILATYRSSSSGEILGPRAAPHVWEATERALVSADFSRFNAPALMFFSVHHVPSDLAPWLLNDSADVALFARKFLTPIERERTRVRRLVRGGEAIEARVHHYQFLADPEGTEAAIRAFLGRHRIR
jgi:pimeloyl-ACP methyl ester carboxylesterase